MESAAEDTGSALALFLISLVLLAAVVWNIVAHHFDALRDRHVRRIAECRRRPLSIRHPPAVPVLYLFHHGAPISCLPSGHLCAQKEGVPVRLRHTSRRELVLPDGRYVGCMQQHRLTAVAEPGQAVQILFANGRLRTVAPRMFVSVDASGHLCLRRHRRPTSPRFHFSVVYRRVTDETKKSKAASKSKKK